MRYAVVVIIVRLCQLESEKSEEESVFLLIYSGATPAMPTGAGCSRLKQPGETLRDPSAEILLG